jgi:uncharacterized protein (DUF1778 family)
MAKTRGKTKARRPKPLKDDLIRFRVTSEEKTGLEGAATREGMDLSTWIRRLALQAAGLLPGASDIHR